MEIGQGENARESWRRLRGVDADGALVNRFSAFAVKLCGATRRELIAGDFLMMGKKMRCTNNPPPTFVGGGFRLCAYWRGSSP